MTDVMGDGKPGKMEAFVDLHSHYIPGVDDGVRTREDAIALLRGLSDLGFAHAVATPHIRSGMFENDPKELKAAFDELNGALQTEDGLPERSLGAEHHFDDLAWPMLRAGGGLPYRCGTAVLVEFPEARLPLHADRQLFELRATGVQPVLAHPERYRPFFSNSDDLQVFLNAGVLLLLDLMSLVGQYGRKPKKAAERLLDEGCYFAACSDAHRPAHIDIVAKGMEKLRKRCGDEQFQRLLRENPRSLVGKQGTPRAQSPDSAPSQAE